ncbi:peptidoglycan-binding protein [Ferviditalea candida]|uniref:Peptidoglycan-binding protein n=1 Tax=Ferviditalea candida TaxID=3108399 RepID=A0ABU5ZD40_9BACL|nr:peptidoglycan-binding protein [Paenibacillaceae bacterium T2]
MGKKKINHIRKMFLVSLVVLFLGISVSTNASAFGYGSQGPDVYAVQGMLKSLGYFTGQIDGIYGPITVRAVKLFQQSYGLPVTGAVDSRTLQSILWAYGNLKIPKEPAPTPAPKPPGKPGIPQLSAEEQQMVNLVNQERSKNGLKPLIADLELSRVARIKSQEMVDRNYFSHQSPLYGSPFEMMKKFGISFTSAGENIACNRSVEAAHQALMASQGHRENILNSSFTHIGIGIADGGPCGKMFTQQFIRK